jgi:gliding motility-associated protein GldE
MSGSESALFSIKPEEKNKLKSEDSKEAKTIIHLLSNPRDLLATILIVNNFVIVGIVILATFALDEEFPTKPGNELIRFLIEVVGITFMILLIGEVIPKIYATNNAEKASRWVARPLYLISRTPPVSWLKWVLVSGSKFISLSKKQSANISADELEHAIALTKESATSDGEQKLLEGIVKFGRTEASQIMKPRIEMAALDADSNFKEVLAFVLEAGYSRIPVYKENTDNVIGILYIKDLLPYLSNEQDFNWITVIRKPFFIPENKKINDLLQEFRSMKMHLAVVVDEYGGASGIITLEDILEEIVGDITDEFDDDEISYQKLDDTTYIFEGRTTLNDFYKVVGSDGKEFEALKGDAETIGGFINEQAGRIMKNKEFITQGNFKLIIESSDKRRVKQVRVLITS